MAWWQLMNNSPLLASIASQTTVTTGDLRPLRIQLVADSAAALLALLVATTLAVYKPRGMTPYGWHTQLEQRNTRTEAPR
jgi:hypothetical protein